MTDIEKFSGLYGRRLSADVNVVTALHSALTNIENCITNNSEISMASCVASAYSACLACLSEDEKEPETTIIDIGDRCTVIGIFKRGKLVYTSSIPISTTFALLKILPMGYAQA